jgi:hypothetical protein
MNQGFNLDTLAGTRIQKHAVLRLLYPWSLFRSFVMYLGLQPGTYLGLVFGILGLK